MCAGYLPAIVAAWPCNQLAARGAAFASAVPGCCQTGTVDEGSLSRLAEGPGNAVGGSAALAAATACAQNAAGPCAVILVEGLSDQSALQTLAARYGRNLGEEAVFVVPMGGATNIGHFLDRFGPAGFGVRLAGLCDEAEEDAFRRGVERAGLGQRLTREGLEVLGFYVCVADLEDELIRSLGVAVVEQLIEAEGELGPFRTFCRQPAQRGRTRAQQLRRFMGTRSGRKIRYGQVLAGALDLRRVPRPLAGVLSRV